jgi:hypothetical protein
MDALQKLLAVPSWAVEFCPVYLIAAAVVVVINVYVLVSLGFMSSAALRALSTQTNMSITQFVVTLILNTVVVGFMGSLQYWVCKSALSPKEAFAVKCKTTKDCTDVAGRPQGSACTCGARGVCGSCLFQNNMEPSLFPDNDGGIMPYAEGFRVRAPFRRSGAKHM